MAFIGEYQDAEKAEKLARERGWQGNDDPTPFLDFVLDDSKMDRAQSFGSLEAAVAWVKKAITEKKTVFGQGTVTEIESVPFSARCRYCICKGSRPVREWIVESDGIADMSRVDNDCTD